MMSKKASVISCIDPMSSLFKTLDPFLFCAYHVDHFPAGDNLMRAPRKGNGADFNPNAPYRMYHGDDVPGFPQHPHRGFETLTCTVSGLVDHSDSLGSAGRYGEGDLQWMTAGKGIVHGEMFPLLNTNKPNPAKLFQVWLNLSKKNKMVDPCYVMHWHEEIPKYISPDGKVTVTVWAGSFNGKQGLTPPPNSYGSNESSELGVWFFQILPGGTITIPSAAGGDAINRKVYFTEGEKITIDEQVIRVKSEVTVKASQSIEITNTDNTTAVELLILQGRPLKEPVAQQGPFVMNTNAEIQQAFMDYRRTQFGGWPWPEDAMIFPREKGRFSLQDGKEIVPPTVSTTIRSEL